MKGFTIIELMIVVMIIGILTVIIVPALSRDSEEPAVVETSVDPNYGRLKNPDGSLVRPSNDQRHLSNAGNSTDTNIGYTINEECHDGIVYLFASKNGKDYMTPKQDTFGYNVKCSQ